MRSLHRSLLVSAWSPLLLLAACGSDTKAKVALDAAVESDGPVANVPVDTATAAIDAGMIVIEGCPVAPATRPAGTPTWSTAAGFKNAMTWYTGPQAAYIAENVLFYQTPVGGWPKNVDMSYRVGVDALGVAGDGKPMFDNTATSSQIRYMAYMSTAFPACERYLASFTKGMTYVFTAQYPNGGWPQVYPIEPNDYSRHITYNDSAMTRILQLLEDIVYAKAEFAFVPATMLAQATAALNKGIDCVLKTQIVVGTQKTGWCQQHDAVTLAPAKARAYELPSISGSEGPSLLAFLMGLDLSRPDLPKAEIIDAVESAVLFYDQVKIKGIRLVSGTNDAGVADRWVVEDPAASAIWARFYELEPPFTAFFVGRTGVKVATLAEVELERRTGYSYYVTNATTVIGGNYTAWAQKWTPGRHVLTAP